MNPLMLLSASAEPSFLQVVAMGLVTVFVVLICLIILIKIMGAIMGSVGGAPAAPAPAAAPAPVQSAPAVQPNKQQLVAAISVAIAEEMGSNVDHIKIHSIRKL